MNIKILISLNSSSNNLGLFAFSLGFFLTFIQFGYIGIVIAFFYVFQVFLFLNYHIVSVDNTDFFISKFLTEEKRIPKNELVEILIKRKYAIFTVYNLKFKSGKMIKFIQIPNSMLNQPSFNIKEHLLEVLNSNQGIVLRYE